MTTAIIVYFAVNLVLMMVAILLNFESDKDDTKRFLCRCALFPHRWRFRGCFRVFLSTF